MSTGNRTYRKYLRECFNVTCKMFDLGETYRMQAYVRARTCVYVYVCACVRPWKAGLTRRSLNKYNYSMFFVRIGYNVRQLCIFFHVLPVAVNHVIKWELLGIIACRLSCAVDDCECWRGHVTTQATVVFCAKSIISLRWHTAAPATTVARQEATSARTIDKADVQTLV